ncbi:probable serine/threonine-protein kinase PIX13 [Ipomoea triloba]|uniref:probable serine/threonine-protein kinase PIX13 n=1 Tax=Ipomoea triloba TaxID=35885 RepID=UPI00125E3CA5|nr:probable serine/threonine-protein kinase PIX13 [Ipomoea triloba]
MGNCCSLCGSNTADANSTTTSSSISSLSSSSSTPGISECNTSSWVTSRTSGYSQLSGAIKTPNGKSSSGGYSQFTSVRTGDSDICVKGEIFPVSNLKIYSFGDMKAATNKFRQDTILGSGGFGTVYKGWVNGKTLAPSKYANRMCVAIKKLSPDGSQGFEQWQSEVNFLGKLSHPNVVKLIGYCQEDEELLLVYEFMQKGSLDNHLFRRGDAIQWDLRLKIAIGAARGLAFLHTSERQVIYRDMKTSNILLDGNYNAKMSDFGLARLGPSGENSHVTTRVMGTMGHAAPEYVTTGHLSVKSDVYGFGVILLEILTGLRTIVPSRPSNQHFLAKWVKSMDLSQKGKLKSIMDPKMEGQYCTKAALQVAQLALRCLENEPCKRPSMNEVVQILEEIEAMGNQHT